MHKLAREPMWSRPRRRVAAADYEEVEETARKRPARTTARLRPAGQSAPAAPPEEDGSDEEVDCCLEQVSFSYRTGAKKNKVQTA